MTQHVLHRVTDTIDPEEVVEMLPALRAFARTFCKEPHDADDLVQETLIKAVAKIEQFQKGTRLKSWLFTIMRNAFYNRAIVARREAPGVEDCVASRPATGQTQEWTSRARETREAMERLPRQQRDILVMVAINGTSDKDAAEICGCGIGTIKSRLNRSRHNLLSELGEETVSGLFQAA